MQNFLNFITKKEEKKYKVKKNLWIDRSWTNSSNMKEYIKLAKVLKTDRYSLFLHGAENNPLKISGGANKKFFDPFENVDELKKVVELCYKNNIGVDLTFWLWPHKKYLEQVVSYIKNIQSDFPDVKFDGDAEFALGTKLVSKQIKQECSELFYSLVDPNKVCVNDYAGLQEDTQLFIIPGVSTCCQAYSVGYVTRAGKKVITESTSIYYPGRTQKYAMAKRIWGRFDPTINPRQIGIAAYKPVKGLTIKQQIDMQVEEALKYNPVEIKIWQANGLSKEYIDAIAKMKLP